MSPATKAAALKRYERIKHLVPCKPDPNGFDGLSGPRCEDGMGRYAFDWEGQDGEDVAWLLNNLGKILA